MKFGHLIFNKLNPINISTHQCHVQCQMLMLQVGRIIFIEHKNRPEAIIFIIIVCVNLKLPIYTEFGDTYG